jgi:hypothetical protein
MRMGVYIGFEKVAKTTIKKVAMALAGPYVHTEIILSTSQAVYNYSAYLGKKFSSSFLDTGKINDDTYDFIYIPATADEEACIRLTLDACVQSKVPYNASDMLMSQVPFRNPVNHGLFDCGSLYCAQAAVVILRACLVAPSELSNAMNEINSRTVTPSSLFDVLIKHGCLVSCRTVLRGETGTSHRVVALGSDL